ncbi:C-C chemokine receptor type 6-like [Sparus aurata]|uniref:C-C chemokine receptor type 6-like n=1 Tax=Sparus aurata TaxID=8175 RepID=UPI0011C14E3B|nr:C-C chemokine receptor type 6-like [Sparus aurata]XP_030299279.1 C-C chemokine receptor type 6-like [Sparus aurata]
MMFNQSNHSSQITDYQYCYGYEELCSLQKNQIIERLVPYIYSIICILGFVGNSLVIVTCTFYKRTKSTTDVYLLNVAIVDLLFVLSLPLILYNKLYSWSMGPLACKLLRGSYSVNLYSGMLLLTCISADHYIAIVHVSQSFRLRSLSYSRVICTIVWVCALLLSVPTFYFYNLYEPDISGDFFFYDEEETNLAPSPPHYVCEFMFMDNITAWRTKIAVLSTQLAVGFFLPMLIIFFCHSTVTVTLKTRNFQRHKKVRVVLAVMVVFIICHLPYNMTLLYDTATMFQLQTCEASDALHTAKTVTQTIAYLHCCLNPVLYAFFGPFRNRFRRIFQDLWSRLFSRVSSEIYVSTHRSVDGSTESGSSFAM